MKTKTIVKFTLALAFATALFSGAPGIIATARAQNGPPPDAPNFDPQQFRQRMMERLRQQFDVKNDDEWKILQERIEKVMEARRAVGGGFGGMMPPPNGGPGGGPGVPRGPGGDQGSPGNGPGGPGGGRGPMGAQSPEADALRAALDAKASTDEIKAKLEKLREARKANEAKLEQAQEELRKVLSVKQEAVAVLNGLLK